MLAPETDSNKILCRLKRQRAILCDDGIRETLAANVALERQVFGVRADLVLLIVVAVLTILACLVLALQLPAMLVVAAVVQELAAVPEAAVARLLVVLADVRLVVPPDGRAQVFRRSDRPPPHRA